MNRDHTNYTFLNRKAELSKVIELDDAIETPEHQYGFHRASTDRETFFGRKTFKNKSRNLNLPTSQTDVKEQYNVKGNFLQIPNSSNELTQNLKTHITTTNVENT